MHNLEDLEKQQNAIMLQSTRTLESSVKKSMSAVSKVEDMKSCVAATLESLSLQSESIQRIEAALDSIDAKARAADEKVSKLHTLKKWFNFPKLFKPKPNKRCTLTPDENPVKKDYQNSAKLKETFISVNAFSKSDSTLEQDEILNDNDRMRLEIDRNLDQISSGLTLLKDASLAFGNELDYQNERIVTIKRKSEAAKDRVDYLGSRISNVLN